LGPLVIPHLRPYLHRTRTRARVQAAVHRASSLGPHT
jgi:hypothetical protein